MKFKINIKIPGGHPTKILERHRKYISYGLIDTINHISDKLTQYVKNKYMSGGTKGVAERTGKLKRSTHAVYATRTSPISGVAIGDEASVRKRLRTILSKEPRIRVIHPRTKKYLTVPIGIALKAARSGNYMTIKDIPGTPIFKHGLVYSSRNKKPYFALRKQVSIPTKIHTNEIMRRYTPIALRMVKKDFPEIK
jgi:hypothetical protein